MLDILLIIILGFLGSFGHCMGMCGPLTIAFSLSERESSSDLYQGWRFHLLLNFGRIISYTLVGAILGGLGSAFIAGGQLAGIGSSLRQGMAIFTGLLLIWLGLSQIKPAWLPNLPWFHLIKGNLHEKLNALMLELSWKKNWLTPSLLGSLWGLIPCGFLYTAQLKAVETGGLFSGALTMLGFGIGTMPVMLGIGVSASKMSADKRSQLFRLGGWVTIAIGFLTLSRTDAMIDYTGHGALILLMWALLARPLSNIWSAPLHYRRALGVGAFILALAHIAHMLDHALNWNPEAVFFMLPQHQLGIMGGIVALFLMMPAAITSFDRLQKNLGKHWRRIHLLTIPAWLLAILHTILSGSHYLGELQVTGNNYLRTIVICILGISVLLIRSRLFWKLIGHQKDYMPPKI